MEEQTLFLIALLIAGLSYNSVADSTSHGNTTLPLNAPSNVTLTNKTSKSLLINWEKVQNPETKGYRIRYRINETCLCDHKMKIPSRKLSSIFVCKNVTSIWLEDLVIYANYCIEVVAFKNSSFSINGSCRLFQTDEGVPSLPPKIHAAANQSSTSISVWWMPIEKVHRRGKIIKYIVRVTEAEKGIVTNTTSVDNTGNNTVTIEGLKKYTLYNVSVSAATSKGTSNASAVYQLRTAEDAPEGSPTLKDVITEVTHHSFRISWGADVPKLNGVLRKYKLRWKRVESNSYHNETLIIKSHSSRKKRDTIIEPSNQSFKVTNLTLYSNYSVEIAAFTIKEGPYSSPKYFMTGQGAPTSPPVNVNAYNTSSTSIVVTWSRPPNNTIPGILKGYEISFTPAEPNVSYNSSTMRRVMVCSCNTSVKLTKLFVYELYNITVAAFTSGGIGNESKILQTWTDEEEPKEAPQNLTVLSETFSSIKVSWEQVPKKKRHGRITQYQVKVNTTGHSFNQTTRNRTVDLQGLEMFVTYSVRVRAFTSKGPGPFSDPKDLTTKEEAPAVSPNVTGHAVNIASINVAWDIVLPSGFKLRWFIVTYRALQNDMWGQNKTDRVTEPQRTYILNGLKIFTRYEITVAAATKLLGPYSYPIYVTTLEGAPLDAPANVTAAPASTSSIKVTWGRVPEDKLRGNITSYHIQVKNSSQLNVTTISVCANNFTAVINRLEMFVTYFVRVRAATGRWKGPWSDNKTTETVQTAPEVVLNVTETWTNETFIRVSWHIQSIHTRLNDPRRYQVSYFSLCQRNNNTINATAAGRQATSALEGLLVGVKYNISVRAINITAKDGTIVKTPYGSYSSPIYVSTSEGVPKEPPPNVTAEALTTTSINISWGKIPCDKRGGIITEYFIEVHNSSGMIHEKRVRGTESSYEVKGLEVYSNYSVKVRAANSKHNSSFSSFYNTTTHQPAPRFVPENVKAKPTGRHTIEVTWVGSSDSHITGYTIQYKDVRSNIISHKKVDKNVLKDELVNLKAFTEYSIEVAARTTQEGNYSVPQSVKTWEGVPTKAPEDLYVQVEDSITARINWGKVPEDHRNGVIRGYRVNYSRTGRTNYQQKETTDGTYTQILSPLDKAAEYEVEVLAFTTKGDGPRIKKNFTTKDDIPSQPPVSLKAVDRVSPHSVNVSWEPVPHEYRHGEIQKYKVTYQKVKIGDVGIEEEPEKTVIIDASQTSLVLKGLEPYVSYRISVAASTAKGFGPPSPFSFGDTCHCEPRFTTSWRRYEPYANVSEDGEPGQIIPAVLQAMVDECCGKCWAYDKIRLDFKTNGKDEPALRNSSRELLENLDENTDFTFPVYGFNEQDSYKGGYGYIPVIESAGVAFIVYPQDSSSKSRTFDAMISCLPVLLLPVVTACVAGIIMWALERYNNSKDFPPAFLQGTWEGIWWAFVSMTTLGYGDRAPLSHKGRVFGIVWILFGLVVIAITMAMVTSALTSNAVKDNYKLYGTKIAAEYNSPEYNLGTRRNAKIDKDKHYNNIDEVAQALINREVEGILVDTYSAGLRGDLFNRPELLVSKVFDYKSAYGIVLSPKTTRLRTCFHRYMISHKAEVFAQVKKKVKPIETSNSTAPKTNQAGSILDINSPQFRKALHYAIVSFGIALLLSLTYELIRRIRKRHKVHQQVQFKTKLQAEMGSMVEGFLKRMQEIKEKLGEKHRKQIIKFWKLQRKGSTTNNWLRISQVSPHPQELSITDYNTD